MGNRFPEAWHDNIHWLDTMCNFGKSLDSWNSMGSIWRRSVQKYVVSELSLVCICLSMNWSKGLWRKQIEKPKHTTFTHHKQSHVFEAVFECLEVWYHQKRPQHHWENLARMWFLQRRKPRCFNQHDYITRIRQTLTLDKDVLHHARVIYFHPRALLLKIWLHMNSCRGGSRTQRGECDWRWGDCRWRFFGRLRSDWERSLFMERLVSIWMIWYRLFYKKWNENMNSKI